MTPLENPTGGNSDLAYNGVMERRYPWQDWFEILDYATRITLVAGKHYCCSQAVMMQSLRNEATKRGVFINPVDGGDRITVWKATEKQSKLRRGKGSARVSE